MKRLSGFSLMEMMIVLTIVAVVAAASAPMVNKKMVRGTIDTSPWEWDRAAVNTFFNGNNNLLTQNQDRKTAIIGTTSENLNSIRVDNREIHPRLYINTNNDSTPHIMFGRGNNNLMNLVAGGQNNNVCLTSNASLNGSLNHSVVIGSGAVGSNHAQVIIGNNASSNNVRAVAIGNNVRIRGEESVAVGANATVGNEAYCTALGSNSVANGASSTAIGFRAGAASEGSIAIGAAQTSISSGRTTASGNHAIAIGTRATAMQSDSIVIGRDAMSMGPGGIALGFNTSAATNAIAIGHSISTGVVTQASAANSIAIGHQASVSGVATNGVAIGRGTTVDAPNAIAIGINVHADQPNTIVLGDENTTVRVLGTLIPEKIQLSTLHITGDLIVNGNSLLGTSDSSRVYMRIPVSSSDSDHHEIRGSSIRKILIEKDTDELKADPKGKSGDQYNTGYLPEQLKRYLSDRRLKNVGKGFKAGLAEIKKLEVFHYTFKDDKDKTPHVGVMAQDLQKVFPDAVIKGEDGFLRIRMEDMFYALVNAVKELDLRTSNQEKRIEELEKQNKELLKRLDALEKAKK